MYVPSAFDITDETVLAELISAHPFGVLCTSERDEISANHLPFIHDRERGVLCAHMTRANPQWQRFDQTRQVLVVFQGAHGYISPSWYHERLAVPTWNYEAVHVYGRPRLVEEPDQLRQLLARLVTANEPRNGTGWSIPTDPEYAAYMEQMVKAIVGFEIHIERIQGKAKLSQNRPPADRANVRAALTRGGSSAQALARRMGAVLDE